LRGGVQREGAGPTAPLVLINFHSSPQHFMTEEEIEDIRETYRAAADAVGLPEGWNVRVETLRWCYDKMGGIEAELARTVGFDDAAACMLVDPDGIADIVTEHEGRVKQVHAERYIREAVREIGS
jgi:hypothetical protein